MKADAFKLIKLESFSFGLNKVNQYLTISDLIMLGAIGLISPFIPIFISTEVNGGSVATAGFAMAIYLITKGLFQIPISRYVDKHKGEIDDYTFLLAGSVAVALTYIGYAYATEMWHIYLIQAFHAIGTASTIPTWYAIFSRHLDKSKEAFQWTIYDTTISLGTALTASLGGLLITEYEYKDVFLIVAGFVVVGSLFIVGIRDSLRSK